MQNISLSVALLAGALTLASCGPTGGSSLIGALSQGQTGSTAGSGTTSTTDNGTTSLLGNLLSSVLGESATLSAKSVVGTWKYCGTDCVFESESLLAKAGGAVAATEIEEKLNYTAWYCGHWHIDKKIDRMHFLFNSFENPEQDRGKGNE